jgi:hypothetical protein
MQLLYASSTPETRVMYLLSVFAFFVLLIRMIKSRMVRWVGHVGHMGEMRNAYKILVGKPEGKRLLI